MTPAILACINFYYSGRYTLKGKAREGLMPDHPFSRGILNKTFETFADVLCVPGLYFSSR